GVHRDLKPDNIFLCTVGGEKDFVKVLDFGVAKLREADRKQGTLTQAGVIFGTPKYMSPEQCRSLSVDFRSDIYSLGVITYELLTGMVPFDADNPLSILISHVQEQAPIFRKIRPDLEIPLPVEQFVFRMLEKLPDKRPHTAAQLLAELEKLTAALGGKYAHVVYLKSDSAAASARDYASGELVERSEAETVFDTRHGEAEDVERHARKRKFMKTAYLGLASLIGAGILSYLLFFSATTGALQMNLKGSNPASRLFKLPKIAGKEKVVISILSEPAGAEVWRGNDLIGKTPVTIDREKSGLVEEYALVLDGFNKSLVPAKLDMSREIRVALSRTPAKETAVKTQTAKVDAKLPPETETPEKQPDKKIPDSPAPEKVGDIKVIPF
ncbi:MAG: serine/threonine protein kinase, partial [Deltaproteobacteria bacterium]|nr:serine/threonine protein kinase [Deltaproteobacteria bacterium]